MIKVVMTAGFMWAMVSVCWMTHSIEIVPLLSQMQKKRGRGLGHIVPIPIGNQFTAYIVHCFRPSPIGSSAPFEGPYGSGKTSSLCME